jgi:uncharacterized protein YggE
MESMRGLLIIVSVAVLAFAAAMFSGVARPDAARGVDDPRRELVTVTGRGTVATVPDVATVSAGVQTSAATAADALAQCSQRMERVIDALRTAGGERLQTQQVSLYPRTDDQGRTTGFVAENTVSARSTIAKVGALVDAAVGAGANTVGGPALERSDRDALYRDALGLAVKDARLKAEALARAGGFSLGHAVLVSEGAAGTPQPIPLDAVAAKDAATPVEPGRQEVEATVSVSFEMS